MTEQERVIQVEERLKSMDKRLEKVEKLVDNINSLTISVEKLSLVLSAQVDEQKQMNDRLMKIENEPRDAWKNLKSNIIAALVAGIVTYIFSKT